MDVTVTQPAQISFDYRGLEPDDAEFIQTQARIIREHGRKAAGSLVAIGQALTEVKVRLDRDDYLSWLQTEFGWKRTTAESLMQVADLATSIPEIREYRVDVRALYLWSRPSTPGSASG